MTSRADESPCSLVRHKMYTLHMFFLLTSFASGSNGSDSCYCDAVIYNGSDECLSCVQAEGAGSTEFGTTLEELINQCDAYTSSTAIGGSSTSSGSSSSTMTSSAPTSSTSSSSDPIPSSCYSDCSALGSAINPWCVESFLSQPTRRADPWW